MNLHIEYLYHNAIDNYNDDIDTMHFLCANYRNHLDVIKYDDFKHTTSKPIYSLPNQ